MNILPLALPASSSIGRAAHAGVARLINCYALPVSDGQRTQAQIWATPGLDGYVSVPTTGGVRGMLEVDGSVYAVIGRLVYKLDPGGVATLVGAIPSDGYVGMARNQRQTGVQTILVGDGLSYVIVGGSMTQISDPDQIAAIDVCIVNRQAIYASRKGTMIRSEIDDATNIDGLDSAEAESAPDGLHRVLDRGGDLIALGDRSFEVWTDVGGDAFGFQRAYTARIGAVGPKCVTKASVISGQTVTDTVAWVAADQWGSQEAGIVMLDGYSPRKISTQSEDDQIAAVADKTSIVASSWIDRGQGFISFRLPTTTLVYNTSTNFWHERQSRNTLEQQTPWKGGICTPFDGAILVGDPDNPEFYLMSPSYYTDDGDEMLMICRTPPLHAFPGRIEVNHIYLDAVPGVGLVSGADQDVTPEIAMRFSRDGKTWSSVRTRSLGTAGDTVKRIQWPCGGTHDAVTYEFSCSAAVQRGLMQAHWDGGKLAP